MGFDVMTLWWIICAFCEKIIFALISSSVWKGFILLVCRCWIHVDKNTDQKMYVLKKGILANFMNASTYFPRWCENIHNNSRCLIRILNCTFYAFNTNIRRWTKQLIIRPANRLMNILESMIERYYAAVHTQRHSTVSFHSRKAMPYTNPNDALYGVTNY